MKKNQTLKICLLVFVFLFAFSIGAQLIRSQIEHEREQANNPVTQYLREYYGVNYANFTKQFNNEEWFNDWKQRLREANQYGTSTYQPLPIQTQTYPWSTDLANVNPFVELSVLSMSGLSFIAMLMIPKFGKKLLQKKWLVGIVIVAFVFYAGFMFGKAVASSSFPPNLYFDSLPSTASYVVQTDGTYVWAVRSDGKIAYGGANNAGGVNGTDASVVIQSALNALTPNRTWKEKVVLKGNFMLTKQTQVHDNVYVAFSIPSYTTLEIHGKLTLADNQQCGIIGLEDNTQFVDIIGGILDGNKANNPDTGYDGAQCGIYGSAISSLRIKDVTVINNTREGVYISNSNKFWVENLETYNNGMSGLCDDANFYTTIVGFRSYGDWYGLNIIGGGIPFYSERDTIVSGAFIANSVNYGIKCINLKSGVNIYGAVVRNAGSSGIGILYSRGIKILGSEVFNSATQGVVIYNSDRILIDGMLIKNNGQAQAGYEFGVWIYNSTYSIIKNNQIFDDQTNKTQKYGVYEEESCDYNRIYGNNLIGNSVEALHRGGVHTEVRFNLGYVTENSGTATFSGDGTNTTFTIVHGLAGTPKSWYVEAGSSDAKGDKYVTANATNLTVTFATAPPAGTNNVVLVWSAEM